MALVAVLLEQWQNVLGKLRSVKRLAETKTQQQANCSTAKKIHNRTGKLA
jgi:hypothetical protein